jgi:hypothetical protein
MVQKEVRKQNLCTAVLSAIILVQWYMLLITQIIYPHPNPQRCWV